MPTNLHRIQVLLQPAEHSKVVTLAKLTRRTWSALCAELINSALKQPKYRELLDEAEELGINVPERKDDRQAVPQTRTIIRDVLGEPQSTMNKVEREEGEINFTEAQMNRLAEMLLAKMTDEKKEETEAAPPKTTTRRTSKKG